MLEWLLVALVMVVSVVLFLIVIVLLLEMQEQHLILHYRVLVLAAVVEWLEAELMVA